MFNMTNLNKILEKISSNPNKIEKSARYTTIVGFAQEPMQRIITILQWNAPVWKFWIVKIAVLNGVLTFMGVTQENKCYL